MDSILTNYYHEYILERIYEIDDIAHDNTQPYEVVRIEANSIEMIYSDKYDTLVGVDYHYGVKIEI